MYKPNASSLLEQEAESLWATYPNTDETRFWKQYDKLLQKQKNKKAPAPTPASAPLPKKLSTQVYYNSFWRLAFWAFLANTIVVWVGLYSPVPDLLTRFYWLLLAGAIVPWLRVLWSYNKFTLDAYGMTVSKAGMTYHKITWGEVQKVEYVVLNSKYYLKLTTRQKAVTFRVVVAHRQRDQLYKAIEHYVNSPMPPRI